ncbi:hypothetical protein D9M72_421020 [compost metagenome]
MAPQVPGQEGGAAGFLGQGQPPGRRRGGSRRGAAGLRFPAPAAECCLRGDEHHGVPDAGGGHSDVGRFRFLAVVLPGDGHGAVQAERIVVRVLHRTAVVDRCNVGRQLEFQAGAGAPQHAQRRIQPDGQVETGRQLRIHGNDQD